jgi:hypothetical protein
MREPVPQERVYARVKQQNFKRSARGGIALGDASHILAKLGEQGRR